LPSKENDVSHKKERMKQKGQVVVEILYKDIFFAAVPSLTSTGTGTKKVSFVTSRPV
jgi:hypothetical protein